MSSKPKAKSEKEQIKALKKQVEDLQSKLTKATEELQTQSPEFLKAISNDFLESQRRLEQLEEENQRLKSRQNGRENGNEGEVASMRKKIEQLKSERDLLENYLVKRNKEILQERHKNRNQSTVSKQGTDNEQDKRENDKLKEILQKHIDELRQSNEERDKLKEELEKLKRENAENNKLSKDLTGVQVVSPNPGISDLSDPNRPLRLGEKFSELYDNEWTDAIEEVYEAVPNERDVVKQLLCIVIDAYKFCLERSDGLMDKISFAVRGIFLRDLRSYKAIQKELTEANNDYRKRLSLHVVQFLKDDFIKDAKAKQKLGGAMEAYMKQCIHICWLFTVQEPKIFIDSKISEIFDQDRYKAYRKNGKHVDFLVWPAVYLHKGGPLITKGVAQGKP